MMTLEPKNKKALLRTALGLEKADLAVVNCRLVNVFTGEIYPAVLLPMWRIPAWRGLMTRKRSMTDREDI